MLQEAKETLATQRERERERSSTEEDPRERRSGVLLLITSLHKNEQE
jgi:hypothetical protein